MKTYFEWETPEDFRPRKSTESLKKALKPALFGALLHVFLLVAGVLLWRFVVRVPDSVVALFVIGLVVMFTFPHVYVAVCVPFVLYRKPRARKVRLVGDRIIFGEGKRGFRKYEDIESFEIVDEPFGDALVSVVDMRLFDGGSLGFGLNDHTECAELSNVLAGRILDARKRTRALLAPKAGARSKLWGGFLIYLGVIFLLTFSFAFFLLPSANNPENDSEASVKSEVVDVPSERPERSPAKFWMARLSPGDNRMLLGMAFSTSLLLAGGLLMLWGENKCLEVRVARLQASWPVICGNDQSKHHSGNPGSTDG